jgi:membrane fusion protein, multidrug efflux system
MSASMPFPGNTADTSRACPAPPGARTSLLPPENATGNFVKVVQRMPVRIRLKDGENRDRMLRPGMSVEPKVWLK